MISAARVLSPPEDCRLLKIMRRLFNAWTKETSGCQNRLGECQETEKEVPHSSIFLLTRVEQFL